MLHVVLVEPDTTRAYRLFLAGLKRGLADPGCRQALEEYREAMGRRTGRSRLTCVSAGRRSRLAALHRRIRQPGLSGRCEGVVVPFPR